VRDWIEDQGFEFDYVVAEVAFETSSADPSRKSKALAQLFQQIGFSVAHCEYFQPPLGLDNPQSDMRAFLMVWAHGHPEGIKRETLLSIVGAIFFDHYERWYEPFIPNLSEYHRTLKSRLAHLESSIPAKLDVILNGIQFTEPPLPAPPVPKPSKPPIFTRMLASIAVVWCIFLGLASVEKWFDFNSRTIMELALLSILIFVAIFAVYSARGERILKILLTFLKSFSRKGK